MTPKQEAALRQALDAIEASLSAGTEDEDHDACEKLCDARKAIREALAEQPAPPPECQTEAEKTAFAFGWWKALEMHRKPAQKRPQNCGTGYCSCIECVMEPAHEAWPCIIAEADFEQNTVTLEMHCSDYKVGAGPHWLCTSPQPSKPWVGLTDAEIEESDCLNILWDDGQSAEIHNIKDFARAIEAKLREKNNG